MQRVASIGGQRADEPYVRSLAEDEAAIERGRDFDHPLTEAELAELTARATDYEAIKPVVQKYGAEHPDQWGGVYIDNARAQVVALFTDRLDEHEAELQARLDPGSRFGVRKVRWPLAELEALTARIAADRPWLASRGSRVRSLGVDIVRNVVDARFTGGGPGLEEAIAARYAAGERVLIDVYRPKPWTKGYGRVIVIAETTDGSRPAADWCFIEAEHGALDGEGDRSMVDGRCEYQKVGATRVVITVTRWIEGDQVVVGRGEGVVPRDGELVLRVVVSPVGG